jgi:hypothetical protein
MEQGSTAFRVAVQDPVFIEVGERRWIWHPFIKIADPL